MSENAPLFSVLIANYNDGAYIQNAIQSIFQQTYTNWEIVIVDDCSTDNSESILKQYETYDTIRIYHNDINKGCGFTKKKLVELSKGDYFGFLDADDALDKNAIEHMVQYHIKEPRAGMIYSNLYICDKDLQIIKEGNTGGEKHFDSNSSDINKKNITHFVTFKRSFYNKTEGVNPLLKCAEDVDIYYKMEEVGSIIYFPECLYYYRQGTNNNISLGDNTDNAFYWEFYATVCACIRRGISIERNAFPLMTYYRQVMIAKGALTTKETFSYRLGHFLLSPFYHLMKILKKPFKH